MSGGTIGFLGFAIGSRQYAASEQNLDKYDCGSDLRLSFRLSQRIVFVEILLLEAIDDRSRTVRIRCSSSAQEINNPIVL
jgi:hypothetical protein